MISDFFQIIAIPTVTRHQIESICVLYRFRQYVVICKTQYPKKVGSHIIQVKAEMGLMQFCYLYPLNTLGLHFPSFIVCCALLANIKLD